MGNYKNNLLEIFNLRAGGLAIYGGVIGAVLTLIVFTRMRKVSFFSMADTGVLGLVTGQIIGRWGNFFNREAFGGYTDSLFAMRIKRSIVNDNMLNTDVLKHMIVDQGVEYIQVHPTFFMSRAGIWGFCALCSGTGNGKNLTGRCSGFICLDTEQGDFGLKVCEPTS